jgi:hypothetical protein
MAPRDLPLGRRRGRCNLCAACKYASFTGAHFKTPLGELGDSAADPTPLRIAILAQNGSRCHPQSAVHGAIGAERNA